MAKGYHSRSPEEFRSYLDEIRKRNKKRNWKNILLIDVIILAFVFYLANRALNPSFELSAKKSNKVQHDSGFEIYFTRSTETSQKQVSYFLMSTNQTFQEKTFPDDNLEIDFTVLSREGSVCLKEPIKLEPKKVKPGMTEIFILTFYKEQFLTAEESCRVILKANLKESRWRRIFQTGYKTGIARIQLKNKGKLDTLSIQNETW